MVPCAGHTAEKEMKKGFTIVELLVVIAIIGVMTGIVTTAASSAVKNSRERRCTALCTLVQSGLAAYYAQNDKWPINLPTARSNMEGTDRQNDPTKIVLSGSEVRTCVRELVEETRKGQPVLDVSGLFVSRQEGRFGQNCYGLDFMNAIHGTRRSSQKMKLNEMYFGYPNSNGKFRHFKIVYSIPSDSMSVEPMDSDQRKAMAYE